MYFQTRGRLRVPNPRLTSVIMKDSKQTDKTLSWDQKKMVTLLNHLLNNRIKPAVTEQIMKLENIFTLKMETLLIQRMFSMAITQMAPCNGCMTSYSRATWGCRIRYRTLPGNSAAQYKPKPPQHGH